MAAGTGSTLRHGASGAEVSALQTQLNALGYALTADGHFGTKTELVVKHLQKAFGYTIDGIVGDGTRALIAQQTGLAWKSPLTANVIEERAQILKKGSEGEWVRKLQTKLVTLGFKIEVDGSFGPGTDTAVRALQQAFGYTVDGVAGEATHFLADQQIALGWKHGA
ncbi:MAG: peptidoglycan-binding protein [Deltaproteobacteria bacterium]|nr:peptidoglycan-binding protein [Deltaproteobacteria bacterium]